jgi:hypothetical protein
MSIAEGEPVAAGEPVAEGRPRRSRGRWVAVGVVTAVVVSAGAGFAAGTVLGGGGTQPEDVLPDSVVAYLDPSAEQKVNLVRLLGQFPDVERDYGAEPDLRQVAVDFLTEGTALESSDAARWVGDRVGIGLSWDDESESLTPLAAIATTDADAAVSDLGEILEPDQIAVTDGYVVVAGDPFSDLRDRPAFDFPTLGEPQTAAEVVAAGQASPLADAPQFTAVFDRLDSGVLTLYFDGERFASALDDFATALGVPTSELGASTEDFDVLGQSGAVLRAEPNALELLGWSNAVPPGGTDPATLMESLPDSTLFAAEATGGGDQAREQWDQTLEEAAGSGLTADDFEGMIADLEAQFDLRLPDDLETLLGDDVVIAVDGEGLLTGVPGVGLRSVTDPAAGADLADRLEAVLAPLTGGFGITASGTDDGLVLASSESFADQLTAGEGNLAADPNFQSALPDVGQATALIWVDFAAISGFAQLAAPESADVLSPLQALGVAVTPEGDGTQVRVRLVFEDVDPE